MEHNEHKSGRMSRRQLLTYSVQGTALGALSSALPHSSKAAVATFIKEPAKIGKIVVIGAGAFGGWTAFHLLRKPEKLEMAPGIIKRLQSRGFLRRASRQYSSWRKG